MSEDWAFNTNQIHAGQQPDGNFGSINLPIHQTSGLIHAERVLRRVKGIAITRMTSADVVRHPLVARIVDAYDRAGQAQRPPSSAEPAGRP